MIKENQWYRVKDSMDVYGFVNEVENQFPNVQIKRPNQKVYCSQIQAVMYDARSNQIVYTRHYEDKEELDSFPIYHLGGNEK